MVSGSLTRIDLLRLLLATALVMMCVSAIGSVVGLAMWPGMRLIQEHANRLVGAAVAMSNALSIGLVLLGLRVARLRAKAAPGSVWAHNLGVLDIANIVALVYLAGVVVSFIGRETREIVEIPIGNATQIDMFSARARLCFEVLFPAVGVVILLVAGPSDLHHLRLNAGDECAERRAHPLP